MAITLRVGNFVQFPVALKVNDGGADKTFKFQLTGKRISREQMFAALGVDSLADTNDDALADMLATHITGWAEQTIAIDDATGQPADFSPEGLRLVLGLWGALGVIFLAYTQALGIRDGSTAKDARTKN